MAARDLFDGSDYSILVNNAGIIRRADSTDLSEEDWDAVMDVNLKALFFTTQSFAKALLARGEGGSVVNIASLLSFQGGIRVASYTASKHGVAGVTKILANEWAAKGINVNGHRRPATSPRTTPRRCAPIRSAIAPSSSAFRPGAGENRKTSEARRPSCAHPRRVISTAP